VSTGLSNSFVFSPLPREMPAGLGAAPLFPHETGTLRLSVVVRLEPRGGEGRFIVLRETLDARVYLGCTADRAGRVREWLELWVQDVSGLAQATVSYREALSNTLLDARWAKRCELLAKSGGLVATGFESAHPAPVLIDVKALTPVAARDAQGANWALCTDDGLLSRKQTPAYGSTLGRHLFQPALGDDTPLLPADLADARAMGAPAGCEALNAGGGLMMAQPFAPFGYEQVVDALSGVDGEAGPADNVLQVAAAAARGVSGSLNPAGGWLMLSAAGAPARLVESLHVRLALFAQAAAAVRAHVSETAAPMLNVTGRSFRVSFSDGAGAVPLWWTTRVSLVEPGEGVELAIPSTTARYFVAGKGSGLSIYSPAAVSVAGTGRGWLRLRNVVAGDAGGVILEGTLSTQDRVIPGRNDLVWLRCSVGSSRVDLYATVDAKGSMVPGEVRLRTIPQQFSEDMQTRLRQALGVPIPDVTFEIVPLLSSPCDLYALGVLGVRTLLSGPGTPLPVALDELLSLAGAAAKTADSGETLEARIGRLFATEKRWAESLGPQVLLPGVAAADAAEVIPPALWHGVLAAVVRCFTGLGPDSRCKDFGDAPQGGLHRVFDGVIDDLYALLTACRTLIVSDYGLNAEVRGVVQACLQSNR